MNRFVKVVTEKLQIGTKQSFRLTHELLGKEEEEKNKSKSSEASRFLNRAACPAE